MVRLDEETATVDVDVDCTERTECESTARVEAMHHAATLAVAAEFLLEIPKLFGVQRLDLEASLIRDITILERPVLVARAHLS